MADSVILAVVAVAALVLVVALRVRPPDLGGYWLSSTGRMHRVGAGGERVELHGLRGVARGGRRGRVGLGRAHIYWAGGEVWVRQGVQPMRL